MLAAVALVSALAYLLTPLGASGAEGMPVGFRLNIRYLAPGAGARPGAGGDPAAGRCSGRERRWRIGALALFGGR